MAWPPDVSSGGVIQASHINSIKNAIALWGGNVDGNGNNLTNVGTVAVTTKGGFGTTTPSARIHVVGAESTGLITNSSTLNASVYVQDSNGAGFNGGSVLLGSGQGVITAMRAWLINGTGPLGHLSLQTRRLTTDTSLSETLRCTYDGYVHLNVPNAPQSGAAMGTSQLVFSLDESSNLLKIQVKYSGGTTKQASIALT